jgi:hypothetical protein
MRMTSDPVQYQRNAKRRAESMTVLGWFTQVPTSEKDLI